MTVQSITRLWETTDITVMSNVASVQVRGNQITKLGAGVGQNPVDAAEIHLDLDVHEEHHGSSLLQETKKLGLILRLQDALELGLILTAMGLENQDQTTISKTFLRLSNMIAEGHLD